MTGRDGLLARVTGRHRSDRVVPESGPGLALGLVAATTVFLAILALTVALAAGRLAADWQGALGETATLRIAADAEDVEEQARAALGVLGDTPGVRAVRMIEIEEQRALLEPWLGAGVAIDSLPLPLLIDVTVDRAALDMDALAARLADAAPAAVLDDHEAWRGPLIASAERLRSFAHVCLGLLALVLAASLSLAARSTLAGNGPVVRTLRLVGAQDGYISGAFTRIAAAPALIGTLIGAACGLLLAALLPSASKPGFFLTALGPAPRDWMLLALVPVAALVIVYLAAGRTVRRGLRRWS